MAFDLDERFVIELEGELGARLPENYRRALMQENGGEVECGGDVWVLYPIADTSDRKRLARTANHVLRETAAWQEWRGFPSGALAIADNTSGDQLVFLKRETEYGPEVFVWWHDSGDLERLAHDFAEIHRLRVRPD